jgi:hypothetical protein
MRALNQPVSWWGWHWEPPTPMSIVEIIRAGNMSARVAAMLWVGLERGASLIIAAEPPNSGKTTTLSALLSFTPPDTAVYFTRGMGETFSLPPQSESYPTYILINEMSDHIPVYTWDDNARRAFQLLAEGYSIATTMHDESVDGILRQLQGDLSVPPRHLAKLTFIMPMYIGRVLGPAIIPSDGPAPGAMRRVLEVALLGPDGENVSVTTIASWKIESDSFEVLSTPQQKQALADWAGLSVKELDGEIDKREAFLSTLLSTGVSSIPEVNSAIDEFTRVETPR